MSAKVVSNDAVQRPAIGGIVARGLIAGVIAAVINVGLFIVTQGVGFPETALNTQFNQPFSWPPFAFASIMAAVFATVGYIVLTRFLSKRIANITMWVVGILIIAAMTVTPFTGTSGMPFIGKMVMEITHLVAGLLPLAALTR